MKTLFIVAVLVAGIQDRPQDDELVNIVLWHQMQPCDDNSTDAVVPVCEFSLEDGVLVSWTHPRVSRPTTREIDDWLADEAVVRQARQAWNRDVLGIEEGRD